MVYRLMVWILSRLFETTFKTTVLKELPPPVESDIPSLPPMESWVNIRQIGAKGDGETDDTRIIQEAVDKYPNIYFPAGSVSYK